MIRITELKEEHIARVAGIDAAIFPANPWGASAFADNISYCYDDAFAALQGEEPVGYALLRSVGDAEVLRIAVAPEARRAHIGSRMLEQMIEAARTRGMEQIFLEVRASNEAARRMYAQAGFREIGVRRAYYSNPDEDAVLMKLELEREETAG